METSMGKRKRESRVQFPVQHTGTILNYSNHKLGPIISFLETLHNFIPLAFTFLLKILSF